jgi:hypothetical protein
MSKKVAPSENGNRITELLAEPKQKTEVLRISKPDIRILQLHIVGTAPYLQCRFPAKAMAMMREKHERGGSNTGKKVVRKARDFQADYLESMHRLNDKEYGIPATAFRQAAISACRLVNFKMTLAKLAVFIEADGYDVIDQVPLVKIVGEPHKHEAIGRNATGVCDIRVRAMWDKWEAFPKIRFDAEVFSASDIFNLFSRIGAQVGIGEGRPDSRESAGQGFGTFLVEL